MKEDARKIKLPDGTQLELPLGLTYDLGEIGMCTHCGGLVTEVEPLVRRGNYKNRAFEVDFPARNGVCLSCTKVLMTNVITRFFEKAEKDVKTHNEISQLTEQDEWTEAKLDIYEQSIEAMQYFIEKLGNFIGVADKHEVEYEHAPEPLPVPEEDADGSTPEEG